ncbi:zinc ribbon domain-containing protein [Anaerosalibacter bizertensis]|uniref:zinc ribbon domain-containing protein n=1 Tax=Anaerosalibacter bizertensis TaxID=932217 RepID=UPI001C0EC742|nr:zinc ribbon domain-containing protein [Anaerosalibacter bizertensis]MBU5292915.1 zinc ribbon domain-containing protein [Anaerosalibacter bizertensis]
MYCQKCGKSNSDHSIYCHNDGEFLLKKEGRIKIKNSRAKFCKHCGKNIEKNYIYCSNCGQSLFQIEKNKDNVVNPRENASIPTNLNNINYINSLKTAGIGFILLLILSLIITVSINESINREISNVLSLETNIKFINILDYALNSHLINLSLKVDTASLGLQPDIIKLNGGLFLFLIIPAVIFLVLGILDGKKDLKLNKAFNFIETIFIGLFYGVGILILSIINKWKISFNIPLINQYVTITKNFSPLISLINGFIISVVFYLAGYGIFMIIKKENERIFKYRYIFNGILSLGTGLLICLVVSIMVFKKSISSIPFTGIDSIDSIIQYQSLKYLWNLVNFNTFSYLAEDMTLNFSLLKNTEALKEILDNKKIIIIYILTIIPFIVFFIQGRKEKKLQPKNIYLNLAYSALTYSLLMTFFTAVSNFKINATGMTANFIADGPIITAIGFKVGDTFITSFLFFYLISLAGAFLTNSREEVNNFYE